ncbi:MAG TPA: hypothetical protein VNA25_22710 [Phycisphaerae bacterium]|nr:hypothetical protein [Phycisphaerae bacterium]
MTSERERIKEAVAVIVADVLTFNGEAPLTVATRGKRITDLIVKESEGYKMLRRAEPVGEPVAWRPEVRAFATLMEERLRANDAEKGMAGWKAAPADRLMACLFREVAELGVAVHKLGPDDIAHEAADVANFAMMVADVCGALAVPPEAQEPERCPNRLTVNGDARQPCRLAAGHSGKCEPYPKCPACHP